MTPKELELLFYTATFGFIFVMLTVVWGVVHLERRTEKLSKELEKNKLLVNKSKEHLLHIRDIICDACEAGFNTNHGSWVSDLFMTNGETTKLISMIDEEK